MSNLIFIKDNDNNVGIGSNMINDIKGNINITQNLNVAGNINLTNGGMVKTTGQGSFGSLSVSSSNQVSNLNASLLQGYAPSTSNTVNAIVRRDSSGNFTAGTITANTFLGSLTGTASKASLTASGNTIVGTTDTQTLSNKTLHHNGWIGIGGVPQFPLHTMNSSSSYLMPNPINWLKEHGSGTTSGRTNAGSVVIDAKFDHKIWINGGYIFFSSDSRIKTNIVDVQDNLSLQQLRSIPCRYYEYIDKLECGTDETIGFIAQEVKYVFPMAVSQQKQIIPNIYKVINCIWTSVEDTFFMSSTDLSNVNGVKYRFHVSNETDGSEEKIVVIKGNSDNTFTFDAQYINVFCYGIEVDDFHILDKNKLFTLNFSATQEIDRIQQTHITEIASLKSEVSTLKTENAELTSIIDKLKTANSFEEFKQTL